MTWKIIAQFLQHCNSFINNSKFVSQMFLKIQFSSTLSPKCFGLFTFSTTRPLKYKSGCFGECDFLEKITSSACLVESGLKTAFHCSAHSRIFISHCLVHLDHRSLKKNRYHQQIVLHCYLNCLLGH